MTSQSRDFSLDFTRAFSILLIIFFHYNCDLARFIAEDRVLFKYYGWVGNLGVSLFFTLSGASFLLSTQSNYSSLHFYRKRFLAIYPLFWITYILSFVPIAFLVPQKFFSGQDPVSFFLTVIGLDGFFLYKIHNYYLIGEWFLGCLIILYVFFPVIRYLFYKNKHWLMALSLAGTIFLERIYDLELPLPRFPLFRLVEVVFGMYFMSLYQTRLLEQGRLSLFLSMFFPLAGMVIIFELGPDRSFFVSFILLGLLAFVFLTALAKSLEGCLPRTLILFVSKYSYAAFLVHHIVITGTLTYSRDYLTAWPQQIIVLSILTCLIFLIGYMIYNSARRLLPWLS